jgi:hypothetical protein
MIILSRRNFIKTVAVSILAFIIPTGRTDAADKAALLIAPHGKLGANLRGLNGMRVCAGSKVSAPESEYSKLLNQRGASIVNIPFAERYPALQTGACGALLFVADGKSNKQLEEELKVFLPPLSQYEFRALPVD